MNSSEEFVVGKHNIGFVYSGFKDKFQSVKFESRDLPKFQTLQKRMSDAQIESELKPGFCTLGDVLAFLDNNPQEYKDGYANLFYFPECVVGVYWRDGEWRVIAWGRDGGYDWDAGYRVFSPATGAQILEPRALESSDTVPLELTINGYVYRRAK